jgi:hypothetical protein
VGVVIANLGPADTQVHLGQNEPREPSDRTSLSVRTDPARGREWPLRRWRLRMLSAAAIALVCGFSRAASAQSTAQTHSDVGTASASTDYDKLLDRALDAFEAQDYARARELFEAAYEIRPNARVLRGLGISALHLERFTVAKRELTEALRETKQPLTANQRDGVTELLSWMQLNLGTLQLHLQPAKARVLLDDDAVTATELVLKPGAHRVHVSADGFASEEHSVEIAVGREQTLDVSLAKNVEKSAPVAAVSASEAAATVPIAEPESESTPPLARVGEPAHDSESSSVLESWWFWTAVGVVVAGGVATTVALTSTAPAKSYEKGGLGGVIMPLGRAP